MLYRLSDEDMISNYQIVNDLPLEVDSHEEEGPLSLNLNAEYETMDFTENDYEESEIVPAFSTSSNRDRVDESARNAELTQVGSSLLQHLLHQDDDLIDLD